MREESASDWPEEEPEEWQVPGNFPKTDEPQATSSVSSLLNSPLPKVQLPGDNRLLSAFAADCARNSERLRHLPARWRGFHC